MCGFWGVFLQMHSLRLIIDDTIDNHLIRRIFYENILLLDNFLIKQIFHLKYNRQFPYRRAIIKRYIFLSY